MKLFDPTISIPKKGIKSAVFFLWIVITISLAAGSQTPDLSKFRSSQEKISAWLAYCESLRINNNGKNDFPALQKAAILGVGLTAATDHENRARFFFFAAFSSYYQTKFDSAQYYFYQSLHEAQSAGSAEFIANACVALIPVNFQLRQQDKVDSCKILLQTILDTTHNKRILQDGYSAMASYYQQKSYYSTAEDYLIKSIELRKQQADTTSDVKLRADYAIQCYMLSKQYLNTDTPDKGLEILKEGRPFANASPPVFIRYLSSFTELYARMGRIDSALYYERLLEENTKNSPVISSEIVSSNLNIAKYFIEKNENEKALPYITRADTLATRSKSPFLIFQAQLWKGRYLEVIGQFKEAISFLAQSLPVARQISKEEYAEGLQYMALAEKGAGDGHEAIMYYETYIQVSDSLAKEKISRNLADEETRYETNQKEQRILVLNKQNELGNLELKNASRTRLFLILGLVALGIIALLLYFIYRNKENLNKTLHERNASLDNLNHELETANDTKAKLFGIISHDLRSPVSQIVQLLQLQKEKEGLLTEEASSRHKDKLQRASENVLETMEDLLLWSKSQMRHFVPQFRKTRINGVVEKEINFLQQSIQDKQINIKQELPNDFIIETDEGFLSIIIRNLLQNAVKYSPAGSVISIRADNTTINITNKVDEEQAPLLNKILETGQVDSGNSGLGLQLANDLARSIKARISFSQTGSSLTAQLSWTN